MSVKCYTNLVSLPKSYESFFAEAASRNFWFSLPWFRLLANTTLAEDETVRIYVAENGTTPPSPSTPVAAIVMKSRNPVTGIRGGAPLSSHTNFYSMEFLPIVSEACKSPVDALDQIFQFVKNERPKWGAISFSAMPSDDDLFDCVKTAMRKNGLFVTSHIDFGNYFERFQGVHYADYVKRLPSGIRRLDRKFDDDEKITFKIINSIDIKKLEYYIDQYQSVYKYSWKTEEKFDKFIPELLRLCSNSGVLRLGFIYVDNIPVASQFWINIRGNSTIYKIAYNEAYKKLGVGSMLTLQMFRYAIENDGVEEIDYGSGDDAYKQTWLKDRRERWRIVAYDPFTLRGLYNIAVHFTKSALKSLVRR